MAELNQTFLTAALGRQDREKAAAEAYRQKQEADAKAHTFNIGSLLPMVVDVAAAPFTGGASLADLPRSGLQAAGEGMRAATGSTEDLGAKATGTYDAVKTAKLIQEGKLLPYQADVGGIKYQNPAAGTPAFGVAASAPIKQEEVNIQKGHLSLEQRTEAYRLKKEAADRAVKGLAEKQKGMTVPQMIAANKIGATLGSYPQVITVEEGTLVIDKSTGYEFIKKGGKLTSTGRMYDPSNLPKGEMSE